VTLGPSFGQAMADLLEKHDALMGTLNIDVNKSVYNLYWQRTHEWFFWRNFAEAKAGFSITPDNYERYAKGTTVFLCPKKVFLAACEKFNDRMLHSDDTF